MDDYVPDFEDGDHDESAPAPDEARGERRELVRDDPPPPVPKRVRAKGPGHQPHSAMMLKRCVTERSREKQREKELPWSCIPPEKHAEFKQAEAKQIQEHYKHLALTPLTAAESDRIRKEVPSNRVLTSRFAYKDKNYARRKLHKEAPWRPKARLVVGGHKDPRMPLTSLLMLRPSAAWPCCPSSRRSRATSVPRIPGWQPPVM